MTWIRARLDTGQVIVLVAAARRACLHVALAM
jgi:hypothetical protein